jgi:general nucleoside transport system ATP-binding protein
LSLLSMQNITKSFGGLCANQAVNLTVEKGEIHALLGENGAGKTTLMNILYGICQADSGSIDINAAPVRIRSPKEAIALKIGMVHQHFMLVPTLTVSQNITLGLKEKGYPFTDRKLVDRKITDLSDEYGLQIRPSDVIADISVGARQRVEIIKLLYHAAELLILDEPTAVLTPHEIGNFFNVLGRLKKNGHAVIIITHRIAEVMSIADRVTVLRDGENVACLGIQETNSSHLSELMIGRRLEPPSGKIHGGVLTSETPVRLRVKGISLHGESKKILDNISLDIRCGEILGLAGVDGNGQKELAEVLVGIRKSDTGRINIDGRDISRLGVKKRKGLGIAYVPDDRHHDGLILDMDVVSNLMLSTYDCLPFSRKKILKTKVCREHAANKALEYQVKTPGVKAPVRYLSGGNQQKLILARELDGHPKLIVAYQPTRGLDIGAEEFVHKTLLQQKAKGVSVLLISVDLEQIMALSDRIAVIFEGRITGVLKNDGEADLAQIGLKMAGLTGAVA